MIGSSDGSLPSGTTGVRDPEAAVVERLQALSTRLDDEPDARYRARARARLVAMAAVRTPEPAPRSLAARLLAARAGDGPTPRWRGRLTAGVAGAAVGVTGLAALVAVAAGAQPGDPLYGLKRGTEQTQLALAGESRGQTLLELASTRLDELQGVTRDAALVRQTLHSMDRHTTEGAALLTARAVADRDTAPLALLASWSDEQSADLAAVRDRLPPSTAPEHETSADLLEALITRTAGLSLALDCPSGPPTVGADALGPVPGPCLSGAPAEAPPPPVPDPTADSSAPGTPPEVPAATPTPAPPGGATGSGPGTVPAAPVPSRVPGTGNPPSVGGVLPEPVVPLPGGTGATPGSATAPPVVGVPPGGPVGICLPPPALLGDC